MRGEFINSEGIPDESKVESLITPLKTMSQSVDHNQVFLDLIDVYFVDISQMIDTQDLSSQLLFILMISRRKFYYCLSN